MDKFYYCYGMIWQYNFKNIIMTSKCLYNSIMKKIKKTIAYQFLSHLNKTIKFLLAPIRQPLKNFYYQKLKYSNNFYSNSFDWDWKKTNYNRIIGFYVPIKWRKSEWGKAIKTTEC